MPAYAPPTFPPAQYANPGQGFNYGQGYPAAQTWTQPVIPPPMVTTVQPGQPPMQQYQQAAHVPAPMITTVKPGMPVFKPGVQPMPPNSAKLTTSYVNQQPAQPAVPAKPVANIRCNACNLDVPETDMYERKCEDPNHSVCTECVNKTYVAQDSPACPFCKREYSQSELADIHQLLLFNPAYKGQVDANPKKPGAGVMESCVFGHETNKVNFIANACAAGCKVCRQHYTSETICRCGQRLGGDVPQLE